MSFMQFKVGRTGEPMVISTVDIVSVVPLLSGSRITLRGGVIHDVQEAFDAVTKALMPDQVAPVEKAPEKTPEKGK
jgi:hypothetical protein